MSVIHQYPNDASKTGADEKQFNNSTCLLKNMQQTLRAFLYLKQSNENQLRDLLVEHQQQVIESLGGFTNMIELCLSNPCALQYIDTELQEFTVFKQMLGNKINEQPTHMSTISCDQNNYVSNSNIKRNNVMPVSVVTNKIQVIATTKDFYQSKIIMNCEAQNSILFKFLANEYFSIKAYDVISHQLTAFMILSFVFGSFVFAIVRDYTQSYVFVSWSIILSITAMIVLTIYCILLGSTGNLIMIDLISNTFDFWFKIYNTITLFVAIWIRGSTDDASPLSVQAGTTTQLQKTILVYEICHQIATISTALLFFIIDALPIAIKIKRIGIVLFISWMCYNCARTYFYFEDFQWNPFGNDFEYSEISFKSMILSSYINLVIFTGKPILSDVIRWLRKQMMNTCDKESNEKMSDKDNKRNSINDIANVSRCGTVYKRPLIKWNKPEIHTIATNDPRSHSSIMIQINDDQS